MKTINLRRFATILMLALLAIPICAQVPNSATERNGNLVFVDYEQMPSYPDGEMALMEYIEQNLQCPKEVKRAKVHGNVDVSFVVMKDGTVGEVQAIKTVLLKRSGVPCQDSTLIKLCEREAVRVCQNMKKWMPGRRFGSAHKTKFWASFVFNDPKKVPCDIYHSEEIWDEDHLTNMIDVFRLDYQWRDSTGRLSVTEDMKMKYRQPEGFSEDNSEECFRANNRLSSTFFGCLNTQLHSDDGQFVSFLQFAPLYSKTDEKRLRWVFGDFPKEKLFNIHHLYKMRGFIKRYYNRYEQYHGKYYYIDEVGDSWRDSITVYSAEEARRKWNADSAFTFSLHLRPEDYYKKDFKHVKVLLIQRKGQGYAYITSFYTDKAKENFDKYWRRIERVLRFRE